MSFETPEHPPMASSNPECPKEVRSSRSPHSSLGAASIKHRGKLHRSHEEIPGESCPSVSSASERSEFKSLSPRLGRTESSFAPVSSSASAAQRMRTPGVGASPSPDPSSSSPSFSSSSNRPKPELYSAASLEVHSNGSERKKKNKRTKLRVEEDEEEEEEKEIVEEKEEEERKEEEEAEDKEEKGVEEEKEKGAAQEEEEESKGAVGGCIEVGEFGALSEGGPEGDSLVESIGEKRTMEKTERGAQTEQIIEQFAAADNPEFPIDHTVFVLVDRPSRCLSGKIRWTGGHFAIHNSKLAVVELDENYDEANNGRFLGQSLCHTKRNRALMVEVKQLLHRQPFAYGQRVHMFSNPKKLGTVWNLRGNQASVEWDPPKPYSEVEQTIMQVQISFLRDLPSICGEPCKFPLQPIAPHRLHQVIGRHRGIQGDSNSCYLDTTLFCLFGFTSFWEEQMLKSDRRRRDILLHQVVFPLRAYGFVPSRNVTEVRRLLCEATGRGEFSSQSRDLPETLEALLGKTLNVPPMVMTSSLGRDAVSFPASFSIETMPPPKQPKVCTSQHFLESSAIMMEFQLTAVPECLILLLPRERGYFMKEVIPALELDLEPVLDGGRKLCYVCGQVADTQCPQKMVDCSAASTFFCSACLDLEGGASSDRTPLQRIPLRPAGKRKTNCRMLLSAVICISHSHYNCFMRCGQEWIFFDSMSDREVFGGSQICVPRIRRANLNYWIRQKLQGSPTISAAQGDRDICDRAFSCPYALIYNVSEC